MKRSGRWIMRGLGTVSLLALAAGGGLWLAAHRSLPDLDGSRAAPGLSAPVTVARDDHGVPTITGKDRADIAFATGYAHAQDRFFQMDLLRRSSAGELAELVGAKALPMDRLHRFHRLRARAEAVYRTSSEQERLILDRYAAGVNAGLASLAARPPEYLLLGTQPRPWSPEDCLLISWAIYFDLQGDLETRKLARGWLRDNSDAEQLAFLFPESSEWDAPLDGPSPSPEVTIPVRAPNWWHDSAPGKTAMGSSDFVVGSNDWAIAGSRTADGRAIVADDMHLGLRLPAVWYRLALAYTDETGQPRKVIGVSIPGAPPVIAGSNTRVAWGFTNAAGNWLDLVRVEPADATTIRETIHVKGGQDEEFEVRETPLGPVRDIDGKSYAVHWLADGPGAVDLGLLRLETAATAAEALKIGAETGVPELNMVAGDDHGHIGWTIAGPMPARERISREALFPLEPGQVSAGWRALLPPAQHPVILDPANGQLMTANSRQLMGPGGALIGDGGFDLGARTRQIRDDLTGLGDKADLAGNYQVQLDDRALFMQTWRQRALAVLDPAALENHPERARFRTLLSDSWDGHASPGSVGYRLAHDFLGALYAECFAGLDAHLAAYGAKSDYRLVTRRWQTVLATLLDAQPDAWLPPGRASWRDVQLAAIDQVIADATAGGHDLGDWSWGERNRARIAHPFAALIPALRPLLSAPSLPLPGDANMPRSTAPDFGQSERLVMVPGREEEALYNLPGGQSGHPLSPYFLDEFEDWVKGRPEKLTPGAPRHELVLLPP